MPQFWKLLLLSLFWTSNGLQLRSAPSCGMGDKDGLWLLDDLGDCHRVNTQGPCGPNMLFFPHPNKGQALEPHFRGFCDCFDARAETMAEISFLNDETLLPCLRDLRGQIFVPQRRRCYPSFAQGPCPFGKWLVLNATGYPICAKNGCEKNAKPIDDPSSPIFLFSHSDKDGKCYQTLTRSYCPKGYILRFSHNHWIPTCRYSPTTTPKPKKCPVTIQPGEVLRTRCKPGSRRDYLSHCSASISPR